MGLTSVLLVYADRGFSLSPGRSFYVSPDGSDGQTGSLEAPFRSIGRVFTAVGDLGANDTVIVMPGVYSEQVVVSKGGDANGYLTLKSQVPHAAKIRSPEHTYSAVNIISSYVIFEGFDVQAGGSGHGIEATFIDGNPANNGPHHIKIINNISHQSAGSGIGVAYGDFYTIERNVCYGNCATNRYQGSGISIYAARSVSDASEPFRNFVRENLCFDNMEIRLPGDPEPPHSDGNGIIIDDFTNSQSGHPAGIYPFKTLVENNVCYRNGGRGVHVFLTNNVVVLNNTAYHNNRDSLNPGTWRGELSNVGSSNTIWANNIGVADLTTNKRNTAINEGSAPHMRSKDVVWFNNLTFDGRPGHPSLSLDRPNPTLTIDQPNLNLLGIDPQFASVEVKAATDLRPRPESPAVDAGTNAFGVSTHDFAGQPRIRGNAVDLGAFECSNGHAVN
jgi:parallel beta-helix repeat protein